MIYTIKIEQQALGFIRYVLTQRPYAEVAGLIAQLDAQQAAQDTAAAIPLNQLKFGEEHTPTVPEAYIRNHQER